MLVREYHQSDLAHLRAIHAAQGFDYALPDLTNPLFITKLVLTDESSSPGSEADVESARVTEHGPQDTSAPSRTTEHESRTTAVLGAAFLRLTAEAYLLLDPRAGTPRQRWQWLLALHAATERDAWHRGLEDVHAWLPPPIAAKFGRHLTRLGWQRDDTWTPYCRRVAAGK